MSPSSWSFSTNLGNWRNSKSSSVFGFSMFVSIDSYFFHAFTNARLWGLKKVSKFIETQKKEPSHRKRIYVCSIFFVCLCMDVHSCKFSTTQSPTHLLLFIRCPQFWPIFLQPLYPSPCGRHKCKTMLYWIRGLCISFSCCFFPVIFGGSVPQYMPW